MFGFSVRTLQNAIGSPRAAPSPSTSKSLTSSSSFPSSARAESPRPDVGEIDTRPPFESVKAAVSLFGEVVTPRARPVTKKTRAEELRLLEKETQHHMILKELDRYKQRLRALESARAQALRDLQTAHRTVQELTNKLETLSEAKQAAISSTEAARTQARGLEAMNEDELGNDSWKRDVDTERELYRASSAELISYKQELTNLRQDFDAALEAKLAAFNKEEDARQTEKTNRETMKQLVKEVKSMRETLEQVKADSAQVEDEHLKMVAEKEVHFLVHKSAKETAEKEISRLKAEYGPEEKLGHRLEEASEAIKVLREQLHGVRSSDMNALDELVAEVEEARNELEAAVAKEAALRRELEGFRRQLEDVRRKAAEVAAAEGRAEELRREVQEGRAELSTAVSRDVVAEMQEGLERLVTETERDRSEAERVMEEVRLFRAEAAAAEGRSREVEERLAAAEVEAEEAKAAERRADERIYESSGGGGSGHGSGNVRGMSRKMRLSIDEFKVMTQKIEDCRKEADRKVAAAMAEVQGAKASERVAAEEAEGKMKEKEGIEVEIDEAVERAEGATAAMAVVEEELRRWREGLGGRN